jgi:exosortase/archaeosortase family protein
MSEATATISGVERDRAAAMQSFEAPRRHRPHRTDRWTGRHLAAAVFMAALGVLATRGAWADILRHALKDQEYSHIWLVPIVAFFMVYVRRLRLRHCKPVGTSIGVFVAVFGWAVSLWGFYHGNQSFWHGGSVLVVLGCVLSVLGKHALFRFFPAIVVLVFLVPVPGRIRQQVAIPLQNWTAQISEVVLETFGVPMQRSGNLLSVRRFDAKTAATVTSDEPQRDFVDINIVEACNGLRMVWPLILMSYAFSFGLPLRNWVRLTILLASPLAAIGCNVVRILPTIWLYGSASERVANAFHDYSGWPMLPISFLLLMGIIKLLRWAMIPVMRYTLAS